ncbi:MAG: PD-(D/E)XK nuclease family protein, partial [Paracoccus sp. (in: a-proteobacteria)]|nr:PD-(D/E)XK nuclease family protein [Paracoccus sp. (in: a-proteobacteria)]
QPADYVGVLTATGLGGAKVIAAATQGDRDAAMLRGTRLHLLLEHLPAYPRDDWARLARTLMAGAEGGLPDADELDDLLAEARDLIDAPALDQILRPAPDTQVLAEVAVTTPLPDGRILNGIIDRLVISPKDIIAVDYKTNSTVPATPDATPDGILRQMAAYRVALRGIWPDRNLRMAVLWTQTRELMDLPDPLLDRALDSVTCAP